MILLVLSLLILQLFLILLDCQVHQFKVLTLLVLVGFVAGAAGHTFLKDHDLLLKVVLLVAHRVDTLDQVNIVLHEARVVFTVLLKVARELLAVVADVGLVGVPLACMLSILVNSRSLLAIGLLLDPGFVEADDSLFESLVVRDVLHYVKHVVLEPLLLQFLHVELVPGVQVLIFETLVAHLEIVDDQVKVCTNAMEVFNLDLHLVNLLVEGGDVVLARQNVSLQLLNLVVKHEFELLELLSLLFQLDNPGVFVLNSGSPRLKFILLGLDLILELNDSLVEGSGLTGFLLDLLCEGVALGVGCAILASFLLEVGLRFHP